MNQDINTSVESILYTLEEGVATITLNRPEVYNSFNREMALRMQTLLDNCAEDEAVRAIVITGSGKAFCAGQDLQEVTADGAPTLSTIIGEHYNPIVKKVREMEKPVIAAVNGVAAGAGANLALCCDIVVARESASFIQAFSKIGLIPDTGGTFFLPRLIGLQRASALMMLGDKVMAKEAETMGMIYKCFEEESYEESVARLVQKLARMPTKGLGLTKRALNRSLFNDLDKQLAIEDQLQTTASTTEDYKEGVAAFLDKRKPEFKGK